MKKYTPFIILLFLLSFVYISFAAGKVTPFDWSYPKLEEESTMVTSSGTPNQNATNTQATITNISMLGLITPEAKQADGSWKKISSIEDVKNASEITVGGGGAMVVDYSDGSEVVLSNFSLIGLEARLLPGTSDIGQTTEVITNSWKDVFNIVDLIKGKIKAFIIKSWGKKFEVRTPEAVCAVRGTEFVVTRDPNTKITKVYLKEGLVDIDNLHGKTIQLQANETISIDNNGQTILGELNINDWNQLLATSSAQNTPATNIISKTKFVSMIIILLVIGAGGLIYYKKIK